MMQGPVSQGLMQRTRKAYSSSRALLHGPWPALTAQDTWAMAVLFGGVPRGLPPNLLPGHRASQVGVHACYGVERSRIPQDVRATPCCGMVARLTAQGGTRGSRRQLCRLGPQSKKEGVSGGIPGPAVGPPSLATRGALT